MRWEKAASAVVAMAACAALCGAARGQDDADKAVPAFELRAPFPTEAQSTLAEMTVSFRPPDAMTEQDKLLKSDSEAAIHEGAGFADLGFDGGEWKYTQIVCPALPNHLFLGFMRNDGAGDVSLFSASIPRNGAGRVRIIPIRRRGYSLFSPAPINALTIAVFNHILNEERATRVPDWAGMAQCYAALAGAHPAVQVPAGDAARFPAEPHVEMDVPLKGGAVVRFTDVAVPLKPMDWTLTFNARGRLLKASHLPVAPIKAKTVPAGQIAIKPVPGP